MSNKFRKKPVVIEAFQMTHERLENNSDWPHWLRTAWYRTVGEEGAFWCSPKDPRRLFISTLEGPLTVRPGDWIIRGVAGEIYPCKPHVFEATYDAVPAT